MAISNEAFCVLVRLRADLGECLSEISNEDLTRVSEEAPDMDEVIRECSQTLNDTHETLRAFIEQCQKEPYGQQPL